jgi:hypothetical protein
LNPGQGSSGALANKLLPTREQQKYDSIILCIVSMLIFISDSLRGVKCFLKKISEKIISPERVINEKNDDLEII